MTDDFVTSVVYFILIFLYLFSFWLQDCSINSVFSV